MTPNLNLSYLSTAQSQKEVTINQSLLMLDTAVAGCLVKNLAGAGLALVLTPLECINPFLVFHGEPAQPVTLTVSAKPWLWVIENAVTGPNAALTMKTPGGDTITIPAGSKTVVFCNGTNVGFLGEADDALGDLTTTVSGRLVKSLAGAAATTTLTESEGQNAFLTFTGAPPAATTVVLPQTPRLWVVDSQTTGTDAALSLKTAGGAAITLAAGQVLSLYCDGTTLTILSDLSALLARVETLENLGATGRSTVSRLEKDISAGGASFSLTAAEADHNILTFTGGTVGAVTIIVPEVARSWTIENKTTAARLTVKTQSGAGVYLPQIGPGASYTIQAYCDGTDVKGLASNLNAFHAQFQGKPAAGQPIIGYLSTGKNMLLKSSQHNFRLGTAPAASPGFTIRKVSYAGSMPGTDVGGFQMQANNLYGSFVPTSDVTLADGDFLYLEAPATPDANLSDIFMTLNFVRLD